MKFRKLIYTSLSVLMTASTVTYYSTEADASQRKKSKTSQTYKKNSKKKTSKKTATTKKSTSATSKRWSNPQTPAPEPISYDSLTLLVNSAVIKEIDSNMNPGGLRINNVKPDSKSRLATIVLNENFTYLPVTSDFIADLQTKVKKSLPDSISDYRVNLTVGNRPLSYYINKIDKLPVSSRHNPDFVKAVDPYVSAPNGMDNDIIAMWSSHGRYFKPSSGSWMWQRPMLFETVEDTYTMGYVLPFVVPMLENAGAYVMLPRERDTNKNEVIVDNDTNDGGELYSQPYYKEMTGLKKWETGEFDGFIYDLPDFRDTENPFEVGTYRQTVTITSGKPSLAAWYADIPKAGEYAVYVSYKTLPESTEDATYTVRYSGGNREFKVNQTMGGSTWIYLGTFPFEAGYSDSEPVVTLTNMSSKAGKIVTADAVKIGGGMGNISRSSHRRDIYYDPSTPENDQSVLPVTEGDDVVDSADVIGENEISDISPSSEQDNLSKNTSQPKKTAPVFKTSGYPRYLEGARYWLHWAGFPESVYSPYHGSDDYKDDYTSRGNWVNYLAGGSRVLPDKDGLNIPVDLAMALHSDAGKRSDDSFVGTLGIYFTNGGDIYEDGTPRMNSRMLTDLLMRQITGDIRRLYESNWTRRSMWDKTYVEARVPEVPTALIELMSHQNFADMQYGLDPGFRFTVGRAIYKAMARFLGERKDREVVIQPLPVRDFKISYEGKRQYRLSWKETDDELEPTAKPNKYIVFERTGNDLGFHKIGETTSTHYNIKVSDHEIHSFKIIASNEGGISFPSEVLSLRDGEKNSPEVLIINGFTRVSGPAHFSADGRAGFQSEDEFGVPYIKDISFVGHQYEFSRGAGESFGRCSSNYADKIIAGNTFDFPYVHGISIANAGYGFVSVSLESVENGEVNLSDYKVVDLILGKQKATVVGNGKSGINYRTFSPKLQEALHRYVSKGGDMFVSGQYVSYGLNDSYSSDSDKEFARDVLHIEPSSDKLTDKSGRFSIVTSGIKTGLSDRSYTYSSTLNENQYIVEHSDIVTPYDSSAETVMVQGEESNSIGIAFKKSGNRGVVMGVPFESITDGRLRDLLMQEILDFLMD